MMPLFNYAALAIQGSETVKIIMTSWLLFLFAFGTGAAVHSHGIE